MKAFKKSLAIALCIAMLVLVFAGCGGGNNGTDTSSITSSTNQVGNVIGLGGATAGAKFALTSPAGTYDYANEIKVTWNGLKDGETVTLKIEKKSGDKFTTILEKSGLTGTGFESKDKFENGAVYRFTLKAVAKDGTERVATNTTGNGLECTILNLAKNATVNKGMDFAFNGKISETVLNNYLSRAISYSLTQDNVSDAARAILNTGTKYVCRTIGEWYPTASFEVSTLTKYKDWMANVHSYDPEIIFEAAIFETCGPEINSIKIPEAVLKAFGQKVESRTFDYKKMLYPDGYGKTQWNETHGVPDITQVETQMFFYYRARLYIDAGCEALHLGQTGLMGKNDPNRASWTKVVHLIRDYAKTNARRKYVIINCHYGSHNFVGTDGVMLADFNMYPLRLKAAGYGANNAKKCVLNMNVDAPYKKGISGKNPSGWTTSKYPYLVEFDNYGKPAEGSNTDVWGMDEISWIATQPDAYRRSFLTEVRKMVSDLNENGHVALPGSRTVACSDDITWYNMNNSKYCRDGFSDEEAIIAAYKAYK